MGLFLCLESQEWDFLFFCLVYVYIGNDIDFVESTPGVVFLFVWWAFYSELFLYFKDCSFYIDACMSILWWITLV